MQQTKFHTLTGGRTTSPDIGTISASQEPAAAFDQSAVLLTDSGIPASVVPALPAVCQTFAVFDYLVQEFCESVCSMFILLQLLVFVNFRGLL